MRWLGFVTVVWILSSSTAMAQDQPAVVEQHTEEVAEEIATEAPEDPLTLELSAGLVMNTGNTENFTLNAGGRFDYTSVPHHLELEAAYVLGLANEDFADKTAENFNARGRYDFFLDPMNALFLAARFRYDQFAGLAPRTQGQAGYLRNFILEKEGKHRLWGEIGYDLTVDVYDYQLLDTMGADPAALLSDQAIHSARLFLGYDNHIADNLTFRTGLEFLINLNFDVFRTDPDGTQYHGYEDVRLDWENALRINIVGNLLAELKFRMQFDNVPTFGAKKLDTLTQLNLVYTLL
jgi:putative salt-induced outer membrane protein YdiY